MLFGRCWYLKICGKKQKVMEMLLSLFADINIDIILRNLSMITENFLHDFFKFVSSLKIMLLYKQKVTLL